MDNEVFEIKLDEIKPHPVNEEIYLLSDLDELESSIEEVGLLEPLVITSNKLIVSGHRRYEVIKKLGWESVQVREIKTKDDKEEISVLIHSNKQRVKTCRELLNEYEFLSELIPDRQGRRTDLKEDRTSTRKTKRDIISEKINVPSSTMGKMLFIKKSMPEMISKIDEGVLTVNQVYKHASNTQNQKELLELSIPKSEEEISSQDFIIYNNCSSKMKEIKDQSINLIFTSPPYWNKRRYTDSENELGSEKDPNDFVENLSNHLEESKRVLANNGSMFIVIGDTYLDGNLQNVPHKLVISLQEKGWILKNTIIWKKTNPKPSSSKVSLTNTYEFIFHLVKSKNYQYHQILAPSNHNKVTYSPRHQGIKSSSFGGTPIIPREGKNIGDYWSEDIVETAVAKNLSKNHPAPIVDKVCILPILQTTNIKDVVLDPFAGVGTVGKVANSLQRKFIGYDIKKWT